MLRILTKDEIIALADEYEALDRWTTVHDWAMKYYGEQATTVDVDIEYRFNDGDPEYPSVSDVTVSDAAGNILEFDEAEHWESEDGVDYGIDFYEVCDELPATEEGFVYDLTKQPEISFPKVGVLD